MFRLIRRCCSGRRRVDEDASWVVARDTRRARATMQAAGDGFRTALLSVAIGAPAVRASGGQVVTSDAPRGLS